MRASRRFVGLAVLCLWLAGCAHSPPAPPSAYVAERERAFAVWQTHEIEGTGPNLQIWDCALCPKLIAHAAGTVWFGSAEWDPERQPDEPPLETVDIKQRFGFGMYEVTRGEFEAFVTATHRPLKGSCRTDRVRPGTWATDPKASFRTPGFPQNDDHPVVCVSWKDAHDYVVWLNSQSSGGYRLPSEVEWLFGAFGGRYNFYLWGDYADAACTYANVLDATAAVEHFVSRAMRCRDGSIATASVGQRVPDAAQTYDLIGNAAEWTDTCAESGAPAGSACVQAIVKGGSWKSSGTELRRVARSAIAVDDRDNSIGFRVMKTLVDRDATLNNAAAYLERGRQMVWALDNERALSDLERAVELDPKNLHARAARGWAYRGIRNNAAEKKDFNDVLELDPANVSAIVGTASIAMDNRDPREAIRLLNKAVSLAPHFGAAFVIRAYANVEAGELDEALADSARALEIAPTDIEMLRFRVELRVRRREWSQAIDEIESLSRAFPTMSMAQSFAARRYSELLQDEKAIMAVNLALKDDPTSENYWLRASVRPWTDIAGRRADLEEALKIDPNSLRALDAIAELESRAGNHELAARALTSLLQHDARGTYRVRTLGLRGVEFLKLGDSAAAIKDFEAALGPTPGAIEYNSLCWRLVVADLALDRATAYCNRALKLSPQEPSFLDSEGTLLLRQGKWDDAIKAYDKAIKSKPDLANSLYGRGIAFQSRCKCELGIADLESAMRVWPGVQRDFERMGIVAPYPRSTTPSERRQAQASH